MFDINIHDDRVLFVEAKIAGWSGYIKVNDFYDALLEAGVPRPLWPSAPTDNKCLERGMKDLQGPRKLVRPLAKGRGWSLVVEDADALDLERPDDEEDDERNAHKIEVTAKVERAEDDNHVSTLRITPESHPAVPLIRDAFQFHRGTDDENLGMFKCAQDLSMWFTRTIVNWCNGVATRSRGGSYYVTKGENLNRLEKAVDALNKVSSFDTTPITLSSGQTVHHNKVSVGGRIVLKPEIGSAVAIECLIDSVIADCDKACDEMDDKLRSGSLKIRGLEAQAKHAEELEAKLKQFEDLLGVGLEDTRGRIGELVAANGLTRLRLEAERDKAEPTPRSRFLIQKAS